MHVCARARVLIVCVFLCDKNIFEDCSDDKTYELADIY